ncbi:MAG: hypothetical protein WC942_11950, partial [Clostridia bacterium]
KLKIWKTKSILELGSNGLPLSSFSDTMDITKFNKVKDYPTYIRDAKSFPWEINKKYDVFIALQVWEHLCPYQTKAFEEASRIAKKIILSFPYNWNSGPMFEEHNYINEEVIRRWAGGITPTESIISDVSGKFHTSGKRIVCFWEF